MIRHLDNVVLRAYQTEVYVRKINHCPRKDLLHRDLWWFPIVRLANWIVRVKQSAAKIVQVKHDMVNLLRKVAKETISNYAGMFVAARIIG